MTKSRRDRIFQAIDNFMDDFLYYDRQDDAELPLDEIEEAIQAGELTTTEMGTRFKDALEAMLKRNGVIEG